MRSSRTDRPWGARWDTTPAAGVPRRFGVGILMLLMTLFAVLFSVMRTMGASVETFAIIATMVAAVAIGQIFLFGGRYPRAASIWVGACFFPLQVMVVRLWMYSPYGDGSFLSPVKLIEGSICPMLVSIPIGAGFGYLTGGVVGGVFLVLDALAQWQQSRREIPHAAEPPVPTEAVQGEENQNSSADRGGTLWSAATCRRFLSGPQRLREGKAATSRRAPKSRLLLHGRERDRLDVHRLPAFSDGLHREQRLAGGRDLDLA